MTDEFFLVVVASAFVPVDQGRARAELVGRCPAAVGAGRKFAGVRPPVGRRFPASTGGSTLHQAQSRGFDQTLAKAEAKLTELADTPARGKTRRGCTKVTAEIDQIVKDPWVRRAKMMLGMRGGSPWRPRPPRTS